METEKKCRNKQPQFGKYSILTFRSIRCTLPCNHTWIFLKKNIAFEMCLLIAFWCSIFFLVWCGSNERARTNFIHPTRSRENFDRNSEWDGINVQFLQTCLCYFWCCCCWCFLPCSHNLFVDCCCCYCVGRSIFRFSSGTSFANTCGVYSFEFLMGPSPFCTLVCV